MLARLFAVLCASLLVFACASEPAVIDGVGIATGLELEVVVDDLVGPTQFVVLDDDRILLATINGGEDDQLGQVLLIDPDSDTRDLIVDELDKPTGLAYLDGIVWIMERNRLSIERFPDDGSGQTRSIVLDDLANNGRSEGTLSITPDDHLLFDTSGSKRGATVVDGSGRLFTLDPAVLDRDPSEWQDAPVELASGFKHAYAHAYDGDVLWTTEMTDGRFDGEPAADEIVAVRDGADHGWPQCVGNNRAVIELGGSPEICADVPASLATFAPGASPTSVVLSPFEENVLLVALWNEGRIVAVDTTSTDPEIYTDVATGLVGPQHLVAKNGNVYVSEFGTGRILRITQR